MKPYQRKALKDLNGERALSSGAFAPWTGKMSDSDKEVSLLQKLKARKVGVHIEDEVRPQNDARAATSRLQQSPKPSKLKVSFFSDPISGSESEGPECAGVTPNSTNKYFSTPVISKGKAKKKLSPVMEMDTESNAAQACPMDVAHRSPQGGGATLGGSPPKTPLYRSSFAVECQKIVKQIIGSENECQKSPGKRKAEELDVSYIYAEPPPYDSTPFKSMLAWEVSHMLSSMENSPVNDGTSLFGESLLDLERTDMQLQDFSFSDFGNKRGKGRPVNDSAVEGVSLGNEADEEFCIKRRKVAQPSYKADGLHCESMKTSNDNCKAASGTRTSPHERISLSDSLMEELVASNLTMELKYEGADATHDGIAPHCLAQEDASKPCVSTTQDIGEPANATQEIESAPQQFHMLNTTEVMAPPQSVCDITQEIALVTKDNGRENLTIEIKSMPQTSNVTQHTVSILGEIAEAASNTWVLEEEPPSSVAAVQDMVASLNVGESLANTTQVMVSQTVNTTQEMVSNHEGCIPNTTQEMVSNREGCIPNITQEMGSNREGCFTNITQEIVSNREGCVPNTTQEMVSNQEGFINTTQEMVSSQEGCITDTTQEIVSNHEGCVANTTQKMLLNHEGGVANTTQEIVSSQEGCVTIATQKLVLNHDGCVTNTTQEIVSNHEGCIPSTTQVIPEPSPITAGAILSVHESSRSVNATQDMRPTPDDSGNGTQDIMMHDEGKDKETGNATINITSAEASGDSTNPACRMIEVSDGAAEDVGFAHNGSVGQNQLLDIESIALSPGMPDRVLKDISSTNGVFSTIGNSAVNSAEGIKDNLTSPKVVPTFVSTSDINKSRNLPGSSKDTRSISGCTVSPKEVLIPNEADTINIAHAEDHIPAAAVTNPGHRLENEVMISNKDDLIGTHAEDQIPVSDGTHADHGALVSTSTQSRQDGQENSGKKGSDIKNHTGYYLLNEALPYKGRFLASESFSIIQEEENVNDVSVFSAGSLSFVTSTPVPGLNNFPFQKSAPQDPNVSLGCVMEPPRNDPTEDCMTAQSKLVAPTGGNEGHKLQNKGLSGLPTSAQGTAFHAQRSGIPTARRSPALLHNPTGQVKGLMLSKIPPRGIPGRVGNRPPLARPSLPRPSMGNTKQNMEGKLGIMAQTKIVGSSLKTPKVATAKPRSAALPSKLPGAPSHPPSQICTPSSGGLSATQNVTADVQDPSPGVSTAPSTGVKSFLPKPGSSSLPKPGSSSLQPPLPPSSLKSFIKPKSNLPGLLGRKIQFSLLGSQRKFVPGRVEGPPVKKTAKSPVTPTRDFHLRGKPNMLTSRTEPMRAEPSGGSSDLPVTDAAEDQNCNPETCDGCREWNVKYQQLLQEFERYRQLGPDHHGNAK